MANKVRPRSRPSNGSKARTLSPGEVDGLSDAVRGIEMPRVPGETEEQHRSVQCAFERGVKSLASSNTEERRRVAPEMLSALFRLNMKDPRAVSGFVERHQLSLALVRVEDSLDASEPSPGSARQVRHELALARRVLVAVADLLRPHLRRNELRPDASRRLRLAVEALTDDPREDVRERRRRVVVAVGEAIDDWRNQEHFGRIASETIVAELSARLLERVRHEDAKFGTLTEESIVRALSAHIKVETEAALDALPSPFYIAASLSLACGAFGDEERSSDMPTGRLGRPKAANAERRRSARERVANAFREACRTRPDRAP